MDSEGLTDDLFKMKLAFPYEKFNLEKMFQPLNLTKEEYWSTLTQSYPCDDDVKRIQQLIDKCNITTPQQLTMLYLKMDVLQLADVFENFLESFPREYNIIPFYSYSLPGYTWKAGLKLTNIKLDFIKDKDLLLLLLLLENNIQGGISSVMGDRFVESNENKQILYIVANNLYGWAMSQNFLTGDFKKIQLCCPSVPFLENTESTLCDDLELCDKIKEDILSTPDDNEYGYFIECDLEYPVEIKEKTENFPLCPYQTKADPNLLSDYMNSVKQTNYKPTPKLMCDVTNKQKYMMHYRVFNFYISMGMKVTKIHCVYRFKQDNWSEKYIDDNTKKRTVAKTNFEKDLYKLMNNAFFGKTMENVGDRTNLDFIDDSKIEK